MRALHSALRVAAAAAIACCAWAYAESFDTSAANLIPVLRESPGANKQDETLQPFGRIDLTLPDGKRVQFEASWFQYLGDMHLRLVFDGAGRVQSAVPEDLERLQLSPEQALHLALRNLKRRYGAPVALPYGGGLMQVQADAPELVSSYFLDHEFWRRQLLESPRGIVAAVPGRGGILFADAGDDDALTSLQFCAVALRAGGAGAPLSSALYLFYGDRWSVYQPPQALR